MLRPLLLLCGFLTLAGCADEQPASTPPETPSTVTTPGVPLAEIVAAAMGGQSETLLNRLDAPLQTQEKAVPNRHDPNQTDTTRTLRYDGLTLETYDVAGPGGRFITRLIVTDARYETAEELHVGSPRAAVEAALGAPDQKHGDLYVYERNEPVPNPFRITFTDTVASRLEWDFYLD